MRNAYKIIAEKNQKGSPRRLRRRREKNINIEMKYIGCDDVN
jgi:hypothetical protein